MIEARKIWLAPAKLNLFLHITGQREDGYHELQTLFQLLDFGDHLSYASNDSDELILHIDPASRIENVPTENNLILLAAQALLETAGRQGLGAEITLHKNIPMGAGLGGGSSDAATTLLALNELWKLGMSVDELAAIGLQLGADVPVFLRGCSAWAEGVGERLQPLELPSQVYLVITPDCKVSTAHIFRHENLTRNSPAIKIADFLAGRSRNDCESVTCELHPEVANALSWLGRRAPARMTGTGSSVFASFDSAESARAVLAELPAEWSGFTANGLNSLAEQSGAT